MSAFFGLVFFLWALLSYPYITIFILIIIIIGSFFIAKDTEEKRKKYARRNGIALSIINENIEKVRDLIKDNYDGGECIRCLENDYQVIDFNSNYTSVNIKCNLCSKKSWIKCLNNKVAEEVKKYMDIAESQGGGYYFNSQKNDFIYKQYDVYLPNYLTFTKRNPSKDKEIKIERIRQPIPDDVKNKVWRRDEGRCVKCDSNENLEFDHIIPHSKGGANTYRNL